jgi:N-carbamoylputrescine amidase
MAPLTVALLQLSSCGDDAWANAAKGEDYCRRAREQGADVALFPEVWSHGYTYPDQDDAAAVDRWQATALARDGEFVERFRRLARDLDMAIAITYLEQWPGAPRNSVSLIDRHGEIVLTYAKAHTCDFGAEALVTRGNEFEVCDLDTAAGPVRVGAMICFDREFPESARILMLQGAEVILTPNACKLEVNRIAQFRARAYENMLAVAMANYPPPKANGHSLAFDGVAVPDDEPARDMCLVEAGEEEGIYLASIDLDRLRKYRRQQPWGDAFRRPGLYSALCRDQVRPPFERERARR